MSKQLITLILSIGITIIGKPFINQYIDFKYRHYALVFILSLLSQYLAFLTHGFTLYGAFVALYSGFLVVIGYIDAKTHIIPNPLVLGVLALSGAGLLLEAPLALDILFGPFIPIGLIILSLVLPQFERLVGMGDLKLLFAISILVGCTSLLKIIFLAVVTFSVTSVFLIVFKRITTKSFVPLGPFITFSTIITLLITI